MLASGFTIFWLACFSLPWVAIGAVLFRRHRRRALFPIGSRWTYRGKVGEIYFVAIAASEMLFLLDSGTTISIDLDHFLATATPIVPEVSRG
jgi:hypothetical protein